MFKNNWQANKELGFIRRLVRSYAQTPIASDTIVKRVMKTKSLPEDLRNRIIHEFATKGELSSGTKKELLKHENFLSDKVREAKGMEEEEVSLRKNLKLDKSRINWVIERS